MLHHPEQRSERLLHPKLDIRFGNSARPVRTLRGEQRVKLPQDGAHVFVGHEQAELLCKNWLMETNA